MAENPISGSTADFYLKIPAFHHLHGLTDPRHYYDVPEDWLIAISDVRNSTQAVADGKYRDVNAVAAATITAILNHLPDIDLPFVFGGDGATMLIPPHIEQQTRESLLATRRMARQSFGLDLRVGMVPVKDVVRDGYPVRVARMQVSENFQQAMFIGGGLAYADSLVKHPDHAARYLLNPASEDHPYEADFSGFECRWTEINSSREETLSLLIMATEASAEARNLTYQQILDRIEALYGDKQGRHPILIKNMHLATLPASFLREARIKGDTSRRNLWRLAKNTLMARLAMWLNIRGWGRYKQLFVGATDHEKFDDMLRMIISGTIDQRETLRAYLESMRQAGKLVYGTFSSSGVLVTCVIFDHFGRQVHFVDGSSGGYTMAARELKAQIKQQAKQS